MHRLMLKGDFQQFLYFRGKGKKFKVYQKLYYLYYTSDSGLHQY